MADEKTKKLRPNVSRISVETARNIIRNKLNDALATNLSDGDAIDLALELCAQMGDASSGE